MPLAALAANVTLDADITLTLPSDGSSYTLKSGSSFDSGSISGGTFSFSADTGSSVSADVRSSEKKTLTNDRNIATECGENESKLVIATGVGSTAVTPSGTCGSGGGGGGVSSGGGGGGGGGGSSAPAAPVPATVDKVSQLKQQIAAVQQQISQKIGAAASSAVSLITRNLSLGDRNADVKALQQLLSKDKEIYPEGLASGLFGPATQRAVKKFQQKYGISQLGNVGPATRAKLNEVFGTVPSVPPATVVPVGTAPGIASPVASIPSKTMNAGDTNDNVQILQLLLSGDKEIYPEGTVSGYYGPATVRAVRRFQLKYGVIQSANDLGNGRVGAKTLAKLSEIFGGALPPASPPAVTAPAASSAAPASDTQAKAVQEQIQLLQVKILQEQIKLLQEKINAVKK
ncbi:MAG: hypothetical protein A2679_01395 [Candidatus Sungbacteria bacterium RIFCSPHIGHO2_01_FULL_54_26]|nr:MAG: hypothetical protein A2679_01395 [Candidatus Sungbacteria bacterium RIFCSPHIGHO2_01_FULL_54_26]